MTYSGADEVKEARETLGAALEALQEHEDAAEAVADIAQNIAQAVSALFEAERASSEPDGKACTKSALGSLSQTLALLQDKDTELPGVKDATEAIAQVIGKLFPLTNRASVLPPEGSVIPPAASQAPPKKSSLPPAASKRPPADGPRKRVEANIGATTQSNFYVGFSHEISEGGVFLATYEVLAKDTLVRLLVTLPGGYEFECDAYVSFVRDPMDFSADAEPGMGVQFETLPEDARELILRFIRKRPPMFYDV